MAEFWKKTRKMAADVGTACRDAFWEKWEHDKKEARDVLGALRQGEVPEVIKDKWYGDIRATGRFGKHYLGPEARYDTNVLSALSPDFYVANKGKRLEDYTFEVIPPFQIPVYARKGTSLQDAVAIALKELTDKKDIPDLEALAKEGAIEKILYQASGGQDVAAEAGIGYSLRTIFATARNDLSKNLKIGKLVEPPKPKATGKSYMVNIIPMIPKAGPGYTGGPTGAPIPLVGPDATGTYRPAPGQ